MRHHKIAENMKFIKVTLADINTKEDGETPLDAPTPEPILIKIEEIGIIGIPPQGYHKFGARADISTLSGRVYYCLETFEEITEALTEHSAVIHLREQNKER